MAAGLVYYYVRKAKQDLAGATERLELHLKFIEGELSKHEWWVSCAIFPMIKVEQASHVLSRCLLQIMQK